MGAKRCQQRRDLARQHPGPHLLSHKRPQGPIAHQRMQELAAHSWQNPVADCSAVRPRNPDSDDERPQAGDRRFADTKRFISFWGIYFGPAITPSSTLQQASLQLKAPSCAVVIQAPPAVAAPLPRPIGAHLYHSAIDQCPPIHFPLGPSSPLLALLANFLSSVQFPCQHLAPFPSTLLQQ